MNTTGTPANLVASHPGNAHAVKSGVFSRSGRVLAPRAQEIAETLITAPHIKSLDTIGAEEIGSIVALLEALDRDITERGISTRSGDARTVVKLRLQASRRLQEWLDRFGMTPRGRAELLNTLTSGSLAAEIARRRGIETE